VLNILIAPYTNSLGHAGRCLQFVNCLTKTKANLIIVGGGEYDTIFHQAVIDSPQIPYPLLGDWLRFYLPGLPFFKGQDKNNILDVGKVFKHRTYTLENLTELWMLILERYKPDLIVTDTRPEIYWAAKIMNVPLLGIVSFVWTPFFESMYGLEQGLGRDEGMNERLLYNFNFVGLSYGQEAINNCWEPIFGKGKLIPDLRLFTGDMPETYLNIGPQVWDGLEYVGEVLFDDFDNDRPVIYVTSGTSRFDVFRDVAHILSRDGYQVVLSGGVRNIENASIEKKGTLYVCNGIMPGLEITRMSDLVLCHGGSQTLYQAAFSGTFAFVLPQHFDHLRNGLMFTRHKMARLLKPGTLPHDIARQIICQLEANNDMPPVHVPFRGDELITDTLFSFFRKCK